MGTYQHVHIGPGKLALGLIRPIVSESKKNINTIFLARSPQAPERKKYYDALQQGEYDLEITLASSRYKSPIKGFQLQFLDSLPSNPISDSKTVLLTTAVGRNNLKSIAGFIAQGLRNRQKNFYPLFVLACENLPDNSRCLEKLVEEAGWPKLQKPRGMYFLNTVVDRICPKPRIEQRDKQDYVVQPTEHFYEWVINGTNLPDEDKQFLLELLPTTIITACDEEFKFFELRKAFLVNGIHLAIATLAYSKQPGLGTALEEDDEILDAVLRIQEGFGISLYYHCDKEGLFRKPIPYADPVRIKEFNMKTLIRIEDAPQDTPERILRDCLEWPQLTERLKALSQAGRKRRKLSKDELENLLQDLLADLSTFLNKSIERVSEPVKALVDADKRAELIRENPQMATGILQFFCRYLELLQKTVDEFYLERIKKAMR